MVIVGIPGVGKTTVTRLMMQKAEEKGIKIRLVNFGDFMFEEAKARSLVSHRDEMRKLPLRVQYELQLHAARSIARLTEEAEEDVLVVDTHALIHTSSGYWSGLPLHVAEMLKPDMIAVIEADPAEIAARRLKDASIRVRADEKSVEEIREFMYMARIAAIVAGMFTGASVPIILNREGEAEKASEELLHRILML